MWARLKGSDASISKPLSTIYAKVACAKLYTMKTPITAAELLNDQVLPFFE